MLKQINYYFFRPTLILQSIINKFHVFRLIIHPRVDVRGKLKVKKKPIIDIRKGSNLILGKNVTLNSDNNGYHINMFGPVKLFADRKGATIKIGENTRIHGTCIHAYRSVTIGSNCLIASNCQIFDGNAHDLSFPDVENRIHTHGPSKAIVIEDNVWLGTNCCVLRGVTIGAGSVISANSVVSKDIPPMAIAGGNPAKVFKLYTV